MPVCGTWAKQPLMVGREFQRGWGGNKGDSERGQSPTFPARTHPHRTDISRKPYVLNFPYLPVTLGCHHAFYTWNLEAVLLHTTVIWKLLTTQKLSILTQNNNYYLLHEMSECLVYIYAYSCVHAVMFYRLWNERYWFNFAYWCWHL